MQIIPALVRLKGKSVRTSLCSACILVPSARSHQGNHDGASGRVREHPGRGGGGRAGEEPKAKRNGGTEGMGGHCRDHDLEND